MSLFIDLDAADQAVSDLQDAVGPIDTGGPEHDVFAYRTPNMPTGVASAFSAAFYSGRAVARNTRTVARCIEVGAQATRLADRLES